MYGLGRSHDLYGRAERVGRYRSSGSQGVKFCYEMDTIMGGLLGIPRYSKIEAAVLLPSAAGLFLSWSSDSAHRLYTSLGLVAVSVYMGVCSVWSRYAKQWESTMPMASVGVLTGLMACWQLQRFPVQDEQKKTVTVVAGIFGAIIAGTSAVMHVRAPAREELHDR